MNESPLTSDSLPDSSSMPVVDVEKIKDTVFRRLRTANILMLIEIVGQLVYYSCLKIATRISSYGFIDSAISIYWIVNIVIWFFLGFYWIRIGRISAVWRSVTNDQYGLSILPRLWIVKGTAGLQFVLAIYSTSIFVAWKFANSLFNVTDAVWGAVINWSVILVVLLLFCFVMASTYMLFYGCYRATGESHILVKLRRLERIWLYGGTFLTALYFAKLFCVSTVILVLIGIVKTLGRICIFILAIRLAGFCRETKTFDPAEEDGVFAPVT